MGGDAFGSARSCAYHPARRDTSNMLPFTGRWSARERGHDLAASRSPQARVWQPSNHIRAWWDVCHPMNSPASEASKLRKAVVIGYGIAVS
jgi:hypothetical protein